ncbi:MAG: 3'-5' exonuclease [Deferribacteraceae bacterium]|jgi:DNA polymerase-3 subunit epsilon|nr:3'-5' exonuclease [Deferribacteraceae bacterium]
MKMKEIVKSLKETNKPSHELLERVIEVAWLCREKDYYRMVIFSHERSSPHAHLFDLEYNSLGAFEITKKHPAKPEDIIDYRPEINGILSLQIREKIAKWAVINNGEIYNNWDGALDMWRSLNCEENLNDPLLIMKTVCSEDDGYGIVVAVRALEHEEGYRLACLSEPDDPRVTFFYIAENAPKNSEDIIDNMYYEPDRPIPRQIREKVAKWAKESKDGINNWKRLQNAWDIVRNALKQYDKKSCYGYNLNNSNIDFTAIDFETATGSRNSICQVGLVRVEEGVIVSRYCGYIRPPDNYIWRNFSTNIHGIYPNDTADAPSFAESYPEWKHFIEGKTLVAHNMAFDLSCLQACLKEFYGLEMEFKTYCTMKTWRGVFESAGLSVCCKQLGINLLKHHDALADAEACAELFLAAIHSGRELKS